MKRARYLVFLELCFVGILCLATFLFAIFTMQDLDGASPFVPVLAFLQIGMTFATLIVTHLTLRTVFRRGAEYEAPLIAASNAFKAVPVVIGAMGVFHVLLLQLSNPAMREFGWSFTRDMLIYIFGMALGWHILTAWLLNHAPAENS